MLAHKKITSSIRLSSHPLFQPFFPLSILSLFPRSSRVFFLNRERASKTRITPGTFYQSLNYLSKSCQKELEKGIRAPVKFKMAADLDSQKRKGLAGAHYKNSELPQKDEPLSQPKHHIREQLAGEFGRVDTGKLFLFGRLQQEDAFKGSFSEVLVEKSRFA